MPEFLAQSCHPRDAAGTAARAGDAVMTVPIQIQAGSHAITAGPLPTLLRRVSPARQQASGMAGQIAALLARSWPGWAGRRSPDA